MVANQMFLALCMCDVQLLSRIISDCFWPDCVRWFGWNKILPERVSQTISMPVQSQSGTDTY